MGKKDQIGQKTYYRTKELIRQKTKKDKRPNRQKTYNRTKDRPIIGPKT